MKRYVLAGAAAGLGAGVVFGVMMHMMSAPGPGGTPTPMLAMVAQIVGSSSLRVGWSITCSTDADRGGTGFCPAPARAAWAGACFSGADTASRGGFSAA